MAVQITYFVHGTTTDNEQGLCTGWNPGELSALGILQSTQLAEQVVDQRFDAVYCSDLQRAVDTARLVFGERYTTVQDGRLRECNYGDHNGAPEHAFKEGRMKEHIDTPFTNGESYKDVEERIAEFLKHLKSGHDTERVAVVAHQAPQLALDVLLKNKTWEQAIDEDWRHTKSWQPGWEYELP